MATDRYCPRCAESFPHTVKVCPSHDTKLVTQMDDNMARIGQVIDERYRLQEVIGKGGMGVVYRATQLSVDRDVALKVLRKDVMDDEEAFKRFEREARIVSNLTHPNTVTVHDFGTTDDGLHYISMEMVDGISLSGLIRAEGRLPPHRALRIAGFVADSLSEAHEKGLIHRDLKPSNIIVQQQHGQPDFARVLDFGIAKQVHTPESLEALTLTGVVFGTPYYMSPEQAQAKPVDGRSDVYALGCILFEMLNGRPPYMADNPMSVMMAHLTNDLPPQTDFPEVQDVSIRIRRLLEDMTAKAPAQRPTAAQCRKAIDTLRDAAGRGVAEPDHADLGLVLTQSEEAVCVDGPTHDAPAVVGNKRRLVYGLLALLALVGLGAWALQQGPEEPASTPDWMHKTPVAEPDNGETEIKTQPAPDHPLRTKTNERLAALGIPAAPAPCRTGHEDTLRSLQPVLEALTPNRRAAPTPALQQARKGLEGALPTNQPDNEYWWVLAEARFRTGAPETDTLAAAERALSTCPDFAVVHGLVGHIHFEHERYQEATDAYEQAVALAPNDLRARSNLGIAYYFLDRYEDAIQALTELLKRAPGDAGAHLIRAQAYANTKGWAKARDDLMVAEKLDPNNAEVPWLLGNIEGQLGKSGNAAFCRSAALGHAKATSRCKTE